MTGLGMKPLPSRAPLSLLRDFVLVVNHIHTVLSACHAHSTSKGYGESNPSKSWSPLPLSPCGGHCSPDDIHCVRESGSQTSPSGYAHSIPQSSAEEIRTQDSHATASNEITHLKQRPDLNPMVPKSETLALPSIQGYATLKCSLTPRGNGRYFS